MDKNDLKASLAQFHCTDNIYRHSLARDVLYTDGVRFFAQNASTRKNGGAYWFLDILATEPAIRRQGMTDFASITLTVTGSSAKILVTDGNDDSPAVFGRDIEFTDCPEGEWKFFFENGTICLSSER
jgi:hypothetical protein